MSEEENDLERFIRFSRAIAKNIPTEDGEELGDLLHTKHQDDLTGLMIDLAKWLLNTGFDEDDTVSLLKAAMTYSAYIAFNTEATERELKA